MCVILTSVYTRRREALKEIIALYLPIISRESKRISKSICVTVCAILKTLSIAICLQSN